MENEFCNDVACGENGWRGWLDFWDLQGGGGYFFDAWTKGQLQILAEQLHTTITALGNAGIDWTQTPLADVSIRLYHGGDTSYEFSSWPTGPRIWITPEQLVNYRTLYHEIGHTFALQRDFEAATNGGCGLILCKRYAADGYYFRKYGRSGKGHLLRAHETWADAFSVFVFTMAHGDIPRPDNPGWGGTSGINMNLFNDLNHMEATMVNIHVTTQNILVSRYGYGR